MQYLQTFGAMEAIAFIVLVTVAVALRRWLVRAERAGRFDRSRYVYRRDTVASAGGLWASPHQRSAAERNQPEQELAPLPFRDRPPTENLPADRSM